MGTRPMITRPLMLALGWTALALGVIGIVVPGLPTVPFLLVAAWAFERGSGRVHAWLVGHPRLGPPIRAWRAHGVISRRGKVAAVVGMTAAVPVAAVAGLPAWALALQAIVLVAVAVYILRRPSVPAGDPLAGGSA